MIDRIHCIAEFFIDHFGDFLLHLLIQIIKSLFVILVSRSLPSPIHGVPLPFEVVDARWEINFSRYKGFNWNRCVFGFQNDFFEKVNKRVNIFFGAQVLVTISQAMRNSR